jgi:hypothetical protein
VEAVRGAFEFRLLCVRVAVADVVGLRELGPPRPAPARRPPTPRAADATATRTEPVRAHATRAGAAAAGALAMPLNNALVCTPPLRSADVAAVASGLLAACAAAGLAHVAAAQRAGA